MKKLLIVAALAIGGKVLLDNMERKAVAEGRDRGIQKAVAEMNQRFPLQLDEHAIAERVEFSNRVVRYFITFTHGQELTESMQTDLQQRLKAYFCAQRFLRDANVSVEFEITKTGLRRLSDKLTNETWVVAARAEDCK